MAVVVRLALARRLLNLHRNAHRVQLADGPANGLKTVQNQEVRIEGSLAG